uniref:GIT domain-containing protein n=1 Tax=Gongylonema pulchrum TaxID=637853 RepID=A0A183E8L7_9BILA
LLWIYGADAGQLNAIDLTPSQVAKLENHTELAARLEELQFEVTNRMTMFLCGRRPDHSKQQYFLIPELTGQNAETVEMKSARRQLRSLPSYYFERIVQDVYDEPNPELSATRNQLRQKLAKCDMRAFATLIIDVLNEAKRRYYGLPLSCDTDDSMETLSRKPANSVEHSNANSVGVSEMLTHLQSSVDRLNADNIDLHDELRKVQSTCTLALSRRKSSPAPVVSPGSSISSSMISNNRSVPPIYHASSGKPPLEPQNADLHGISGRRYGSGFVSSSPGGRVVSQQRSFSQRSGAQQQQQSDYNMGNEAVDPGIDSLCRNRNEFLDAADRRIDEEELHGTYRCTDGQ